MMLDLARKSAKFIGVVFVVALVGGTIAVWIGWDFVRSTVNYVVSNLAGRSGISPFLVRGAVIILSMGFFFSVAKYAHSVFGLLALGWNPLSFYKNKYGIVIVLYVGLFSLAMYQASRNAYAYKWCAETPDGISTFDGPGKDPVYGMQSAPCTLKQIEAIRNQNDSLSPHLLNITDSEKFKWFDGITGKPRVWYAVAGLGSLRFFDRPGTDPATGQTLNPVTQQIVGDLIAKQQEAEGREAVVRKEEAEKAAQQNATAEAKAARDAALSKADEDSRTAQNELSSGDYEGAIATCSSVLKAFPRHADCSEIKHEASIQLAHRLVIDGQRNLQQGNYDMAGSKAAKAMALDPDNRAAAKLKGLAEQLKPTAPN